MGGRGGACRGGEEGGAGGGVGGGEREGAGGQDPRVMVVTHP